MSRRLAPAVRLLAVRLLAGLLACLPAAPAGAKTLVFCAEGSPEGLNPQIVTTSTGMDAARPMFNTLLEFVPGTTELRPALAESWTISPDGLVYTFRLREGVRFHENAQFRPTRTMNADDVVFSIERQWKDDHPYHAVSGGRYEYFRDLGMPDLLAAVERVDARTVRIRLTRPDAPFLSNLALISNAVLSAEYGAQLLAAGTPERFDQEPIGTGPFSFVSFRPELTLRFRAFPGYWRGRQPLDSLVFSITPTSAVRLAKLQAGECHIMPFPNPNDLNAIATDPNLVLMRQEEFNISYLAMNTTRPPFDDARVRRALSAAIDKETLVRSVYQGAGVPAKNPLPPTLWSYDESIPDTPYDRNEALRLLDEAGHPDGFEADLWYLPVSRAYNPSGRQVAELVQADLAKVGVRVHLRTEDWASYRTRIQGGDYGLAFTGWTGDVADPDNFLGVLLSCKSARPGGNNVARWCDPEYDALVTRALTLPDREARAALYAKAQAVFKREAPWVPLAHSVVYMGLRKGVTGFRMNPLGQHVFEGVDLE